MALRSRGRAPGRPTIGGSSPSVRADVTCSLRSSNSSRSSRPSAYAVARAVADHVAVAVGGAQGSVGGQARIMVEGGPQITGRAHGLTPWVRSDCTSTVPHPKEARAYLPCCRLVKQSRGIQGRRTLRHVSLMKTRTRSILWRPSHVMGRWRMAFNAVSVIRGPGEIAAMVVEVTKLIFTRPVPVPRVHRAGLVHHQRHADAHDPGLDPVRRRDLAPGRQPHRTARRPVVRRRDRGARRGPRGGPHRRGPDHRRRSRVGDLLRHGCAQDPRGDRRDGGAGGRPPGPPGRAARGRPPCSSR